MPSVIFEGEPLNGTAASELIIDRPGGISPDSTIFGNDGNDLILGDSDRLFLNYLADGNISLATALNIDSSNGWSNFGNPIIGVAGPHTSLYIEPGAGQHRYFSVTAGAGETITLDVDFTNGTAWGGNTDCIVDILDGAGNVLATNDDGSGDLGSIGLLDSRLSFVISAGGTYFIRVREFNPADSNAFEGGEQIFLNVSVTGHAAVSPGIASGDDTISGGNGNDTIFGMLGTDTVHGDDGDDIIVSTGSGSYYGDAGNDTIHAANGASELLDGGTGVDTLNTTSAALNYTIDLITGLTNLGGESFVNFESLIAGIGNDTLSGTNDDNGISGGDGNDLIDGRGGDDVLHGETGNDTLNGGEGNDSLVGGVGDDTLNGGEGNDLLVGSGIDTLDGGSGDDYLSVIFVSGVAAHGGTGNDTLQISLFGTTATLDLNGTTTLDGVTIVTDGFENLSSVGSQADLTVFATVGVNTISTGFGNDTINGIFGADIIFSGAGDDLLSAFVGNFTLDGGAGTDTWNGATYSIGGDHFWSLDIGYHGSFGFDDAVTGTLANIENYVGILGANDHVRGTAGANSMWGGDGADFLYGLGANDTLHGGAGNDLIDGGDGFDIASYRNAAGRVVVSLAVQGLAQNTRAEGMDTLFGVENLHGSAFNDALTGDALGNLIDGNAGNDRLSGGAGDDILIGNLGNDRLTGGAGTDTLRGGDGNDVYYLDDAGDTLVELVGEGNDTVWAGFNYTLTSHFDNLQLRYGHWTGTGNALGNVIRANGGNNLLSGLGGNDTMFGGTGTDTLDGGSGNDRLFGGIGQDTQTGGIGDDRFIFETAADLRTYVAGSDLITDFDRAEGDRIVLAEIDANLGVDGDQAFALIGAAAFTGAAGELRYYFDGGRTVVEMDSDGDGVGDLYLRLEGEIDLVARDFIF